MSSKLGKGRKWSEVKASPIDSKENKEGKKGGREELMYLCHHYYKTGLKSYKMNTIVEIGTAYYEEKEAAPHSFWKV